MNFEEMNTTQKAEWWIELLKKYKVPEKRIKEIYKKFKGQDLLIQLSYLFDEYYEKLQKKFIDDSDITDDELAEWDSITKDLPEEKSDKLYSSLTNIEIILMNICGLQELKAKVQKSRILECLERKNKKAALLNYLKLLEEQYGC